MNKIFAVINWLAVLVMWSSAASVYLNPNTFSRFTALLGLGFPVTVAAVLLLLLLSALLKLRAGFIPLFGLIACIGSLRDYCPVNFSSPPPKGCLKVMSYNCMAYNNWALTPDEKEFECMRFMCSQECHVVAIQEATTRNAKDVEIRDASIKRYGYHYDDMLIGAGVVGVLSRFPIVKKQLISHSECNGLAAFYLEMPKNDTLIVVNVHLESQRLSADDRSLYSHISRHPEEMDDMKGGVRTLLSKLSVSSIERAKQTDALTHFIDSVKGHKILVMGDFNDTPISYAHHAVCSRLTDTFRATGNGIGRSFAKDRIYVRIDHVFCSDHWRPFAANIDSGVHFSDHYPFTVWLKPQ